MWPTELFLFKIEMRLMAQDRLIVSQVKCPTNEETVSQWKNK